MVFSRRAAMSGPSPALLTIVKAALTVVSAALAVVLSALAFVSLRMARRVVTPANRLVDTRILSLDISAQTITLARTEDTSLPGRYGLFTTGTENYVKVGSVLAEDATSIKRKLLTHVGEGSRLSADASFSGWYFDHPDQLHLPLHFRAHRLGSGSVSGVAVPGRGRIDLGHPRARPREQPRGVPPRYS